MLFLLDTSVAVPVRDGDEAVLTRVEALEGDACMSVITRVELEGGVGRIAHEAEIRRRRLDEMLATVPSVAFDDLAADRYRGIVEAVGFSRPRVIDWMIAAHALALDATVVTLNGRDFSDIPGLKLEAW
ncbi:PIN domain-containing protein [Phenylobacterium sp.]|uniref:PIN domain-containing protein n=1 Tax=Phenylobacterium sp. TaxID=1871053 RepID=UPI0025E9716E|nr:PIN domain-containing protein [Phenylobacterium sp.]MBX3484821.1 PIN domain-containing protein [Phenylobacterium sp.]MCW5759386.1 PIN domain-containing protein [Phenylobacterium sp.]